MLSKKNAFLFNDMYETPAEYEIRQAEIAIKNELWRQKIQKMKDNEATQREENLRLFTSRINNEIKKTFSKVPSNDDVDFTD